MEYSFWTWILGYYRKGGGQNLRCGAVVLSQGYLMEHWIVGSEGFEAGGAASSETVDGLIRISYYE